MKQSILIAFIVLILTVSCNIFPPKEDIPDYYPLQVGNEWHYYSPGAYHFYSDTTVFRVDSTKNVNGKIYFVINTFEPISNTHYAQLCYREEEGILYQLINDEDYVSIDFNSQVGETWQRLPYEIYSNIVSKEDSIYTNFGRIKDCIYILSESAIDSSYALYAPNIGQIMVKHYFKIDATHDRTILIWAKIDNKKIIIEY